MRGGIPNPEWDEEFRFQIVESTEDIVTRMIRGIKPVPDKTQPLELSCHVANVPPTLIGETTIDVTKVFSEGEADGKGSVDRRNLNVIEFQSF